MSHRETLHEKAAHGMRTFPYAVYHARIPEWLRGFPHHWHDEFEIIIVTFGRASFTAGGERFVCGKDDILLIPGGSIHSISQDGEEKCEYFNILFSFSLLEENSESHCSRRYFSKIGDRDSLCEIFIKKGTELNSRLLPLVSDLVENRTESYSGYELMIKSQLFKIMHIILTEDCAEHQARDGNARANTERLRNVLSYTAEHFREKISVSDAAGVCSLSPSRFMGMFREETGMSFIKYLNEYRLESSSERLCDSDDSVTEIALSNGFENVSYFIRAFKSKFGCTPLEYRNRLRSPQK